MEYSYADQLDLEWQGLLREHLRSFSQQTNTEDLLPFDTILRQVFCSSDTSIDTEPNYKDKELCEKCLTHCLHFLLVRNTPPRPSQICFLLNIAKYAAKDEPCFINLKSSKFIEHLLYWAQPNIQSNEKDTSLLFFDLLSSFLEHHSGIKWLKETRCWMQAYGIVLEAQNKNKEICNSGYKFLAQILEKSTAFDTSFCYEIIQVISGPLCNTSNILKSYTEYPDCDNLVHSIKPSAICVVQILEQLMERYSSDVLHCVVNLKIDIASDIVCKIINDSSIKLLLYRISLIISFFKLTDVFDGIKCINQDPLAVIGFLRIIETEIDKGSMYLVIELFYYALKYSKCIAEKIPQAVINNKNIDLEIEIATLQLEMPILVADKFNFNVLDELDTDSVRQSLLSKILYNLSFDALKIGSIIKKVSPSYPIQVYTSATKHVIKSRYLYSKSTVGVVFEGLIFSLQDMQKYIVGKNTAMNESLENGFSEFIQTLLEAILVYLQSFNLNWCDSVKVLDLAHILNAGNSICQWTVAINLAGFNIMQEVISRRLSPAMSLLIDYDEDLMATGPILYQKCFTTEWEVRKGVLELIYTISKSANNSFPSFKSMLIEASIPSLISTMALNDENPKVKATALKCLNEMIIMENMDELLQKNSLLNKVLGMMDDTLESEVMVEAIKLITTAYLQGDERGTNGLELVILIKAYRVLEAVALKINDGPVQVVAIEFWTNVFKKHLSNVGWLDRTFPAVTFSKRIVTMTSEEVQKRVYKVLTELSVNGCLTVFKRISVNPEARGYITNQMKKMQTFFQIHKITPDIIEFHQNRFGNTRKLRTNNTETDSESVIQELINDTMMKIMPECSNELFTHYQETGERPLMELCPAPFNFRNPERILEPIGEVSPLEFVDFVYQWSANAAPDENEKLLQEIAPDRNDSYSIDY